MVYFPTFTWLLMVNVGQLPHDAFNLFIHLWTLQLKLSQSHPNNQDDPVVETLRLSPTGSRDGWLFWIKSLTVGNQGKATHLMSEMVVYLKGNNPRLRWCCFFLKLQVCGQRCFSECLGKSWKVEKLLVVPVLPFCSLQDRQESE